MVIYTIECPYKDDCVERFVEYLFMAFNKLGLRKEREDIRRSVRCAMLGLNKSNEVWNSAPRGFKDRLKRMLAPKWGHWDTVFANAEKKGFKFIPSNLKVDSSRQWSVPDMELSRATSIDDVLRMLHERIAILASKASRGGLSASQQNEIKKLTETFKTLSQLRNEMEFSTDLVQDVVSQLTPKWPEFWERLRKIVMEMLPLEDDVIDEELIFLYNLYLEHVKNRPDNAESSSPEEQRRIRARGLSRERLESILKTAYNMTFDDMLDRLRKRGFIDGDGKFTDKILDLDVRKRVDDVLQSIKSE